MSKFLIVFFSVYSAVHALFFFRIRVLLPDRSVVQWLCVFFLVLMITAPVNCRILEKSGDELLAQSLAVIGFTWMGFLFLSFCMILLMETVNLFSRAANAFTPLQVPLISGKLPVLILIGVALALSAYGSFEARDIRIERLRIETDKLPQGTDRLKIVQISDVHLGLLSRNRLLTAIMKKVRSERPDILVSTGDLVDGLTDNLTEFSGLFGQSEFRYGQFAVTGNHESYAGLDHALEFTRKSGFLVLQESAKTIPSLINVVGVDDPAVKETTSETLLLSSVQNGLFTLFLKHRPDVQDASLGLFDLQLSGHTHGGQIFPFNFLVSLRYPMLTGYHELSKGSKLYISRGSGTWGPRMRIFSPPQVTAIELVRKS